MKQYSGFRRLLGKVLQVHNMPLEFAIKMGMESQKIYMKHFKGIIRPLNKDMLTHNANFQKCILMARMFPLIMLWHTSGCFLRQLTVMNLHKRSDFRWNATS